MLKASDCRFGRIKDCRWLDTTGPTDVARFKYGYDRASNRLWRQDTVATSQSQAFDELYEYDGLYRLHEMGRGTLNTGHTALTTTSFAQCFSLDETGNWMGFRTDNDGNGTWDLEQTRSANQVNQITGLTPPTSPVGYRLYYDPAGNLDRWVARPEVTTVGSRSDRTIHTPCPTDFGSSFTQ